MGEVFDLARVCAHLQMSMARALSTSIEAAPGRRRFRRSLFRRRGSLDRVRRRGAGRHLGDQLDRAQRAAECRASRRPVTSAGFLRQRPEMAAAALGQRQRLERRQLSHQLGGDRDARVLLAAACGAGHRPARWCEVGGGVRRPRPAAAGTGVELRLVAGRGAAAGARSARSTRASAAPRSSSASRVAHAARRVLGARPRRSRTMRSVSSSDVAGVGELRRGRARRLIGASRSSQALDEGQIAARALRQRDARRG